MAYNITLTNGQNLVTVADGTTDSNYTSLTLVGKNFAGYGAFLNENYVKLLENFSNNSEPPNALQGQLWWDSTNKVLKVRNGTTWKSVSGSSASSTGPQTPVIGDLWWDTTNGQLKVWGGTVWVTIGPAYTATQGQTGVAADVITQTGGGLSHVIVKFYVNNAVVAVMSKDAAFDVDSLTGFPQIKPGMNLTNDPTINAAYYGNANNALNLGGVLATNYMRKDEENLTQFPIRINTNSGPAGAFSVGALNDFNVSVVPAGVNVSSTVPSKNLFLYANVGGVPTPLLTLDGTAGTLLAAADPTTALGVATKQYVDNTLTGASSPALRRDGTNTIAGNIVPDANNTRNFGSGSTRFNTIYATSLDGLATDSAKLGGIAAANFMRSDISAPISAPLVITNNGGVTIGTSGDFQIAVISSPNAVHMKSLTAGKNLNMSVNVGGVQTQAIGINGATGLATVLADPIDPLGIATKQYVLANAGSGGGGNANLGAVSGNIVPDNNNVYSIGLSNKKWLTVYATTFVGNASTANYADLAERFESDQAYRPGTVVELGGAAEITAVSNDLSENVFGVISTQAAYLMNANAGSDETHPPIAMQGRVPVRVIGKVTKGDRLVSAGNGLARAASRNEITSFNVIGRALQDKLTTNEGTVEAIVKLNS